MRLASARRPLLIGLATTLVLRSPTASNTHERVGPVKPPLVVPDVSVVSSNGQKAQLRDLLTGRTSALQLMFSRCQSICPIEAATFARVQEALASNQSDSIQLLSLSIDPGTDSPEVLKAWLARFGARHGWEAIAPLIEDLAATRAFFDRGTGLGEDHSTAMYLIDRRGLLVWRTSELPAPNNVAKMLTRLNRIPLTQP